MQVAWNYRMLAQKLIGHQYGFMHNLGQMQRQRVRSLKLTAVAAKMGRASQWEIDYEGTSA
jgi:hypothetical protein